MKSRREFLAAGAAVPLMAKSAARVLGANDRINIGVIGAGGMGFGHIRLMQEMADKGANIRIGAVSEIYTKRKQRAKDFLKLDEKDIHHDYHDLLARPEIDGVFVVVPDHWHYRMGMDALAAGKDLYLQKPMTLTIEEAKQIAAETKKSGRVVQIGSQYASEPQYFKAREIVQQGLIGKLLWAQGTYSRNSHYGEWNYRIDPEASAENIDWKRFLGGAPKRPFSHDRYFRWRKYWDYSGGISTDLLYHRLVPFLLVVGPQFPVRVSSNGGIYVHKDREVPDNITTTIEYSDFMIVMSSSMTSEEPNNQIRPVLFGHEGSIEFRGKELVVKPDPIFRKKFQEKAGAEQLVIPAEVKVLHVAHMQNFFDCMRSRKTPHLDADFGYKTMVAIGLGVDAYRESRQLAFDPATERVVKSAPRRDSYEGQGKNFDEPARVAPA